MRGILERTTNELRNQMRNLRRPQNERVSKRENKERIVARERRSRRPEWCYARPINDVSIGMWFYANSNSATSDPNGARYWISKN